MRAAFVLPILFVVLSGCLGGDDGSTATSGALAEIPIAGDGSNLTQNASLPALVDPWGENGTELLLFDGTVSTSQPCYAQLELADGVLIPEGTASLRIAADASDALKAGQYHFDLYSYGHRYNGGNPEVDTAEKAHEWTMELGAEDWDITGFPRTGASMSFECHHGAGANLLDGDIVAKIVAQRDPAWTPTARLDHWNLTTAHEIPQDGAITVLNLTMPWNQPPMGLSSPAEPTITDIIPIGTRQVVLGMTWTEMANCPPGPFRCAMFTNAESRGEVVSGFGAALRETEPLHTLIVWDAPVQVGWDRDEDELGSLTLFAWAGLYCEGVGTCSYPPAGTTTTVTFRIEAWRGEADLDAFKGRLGVA